MHKVSLNFVLGNYLTLLFAHVCVCVFLLRKGEGSFFIDWRSWCSTSWLPLVKPHPPDHRLIRFIHLANIRSNIPLIQLSWDQTGARLLDILDYQIVPVLFVVLTGNCYFTAPYLGWTTNTRVIPFWYSFICWVRVIWVICVFWSLYSWKSWWSRGDRNGWCTGTLGDLSEHIPEICVVHQWILFLVKSRTSCLWTTLPKCWVIRWLVKGILLY